MRLFFYIIFMNLIFSNYSIIQSNSEIEYSGSHPMHGFSGSSSIITLLSECNKAGDNCDLMFKIPIISLNSGNDNRDSNMLNYLNVFSYPEIRLSTQNFIIKEYNDEPIPCEMSISGMNQQINIPLTLSKISDVQYEVTSLFSISLDQFNIDTPKLLFIPMNNEVKIRVKLLIEYKGE